MPLLAETVSIQCPYCGESIEIVIDASIALQNYIEDCSVCCRPIELSVNIAGEEILVDAKRDDE
ncbi:MAG: CPXCG motif-containing cysteine-rich protein [Gammaproteobacteria bacterium]